MSFDYEALCGAPIAGKGHAVARWLIPIGALLSLLPWTPPWAALLGGAALALTLGNPCAGATGRVAKWLLQIAVVGLGAGVNLTVAARVGLHGIGYTLAGLMLTFATGSLLARWLGLDARLTALICAGTGICGGSAIAAVAPAIDAGTGETSASLATVFMLNAVALIVFPPLGTAFALSQHDFGLWCALAIHDTSSVTGAALTHGHDALVTATTVKLARSLWIVPVALALGAWFRRGKTGTRGRAPAIPWFIAGFLILSAIFTFTSGIETAATWILRGAHALLTVTLFFIGAGLSREVVRAAGARAFLHGLILWLIIGSATLAAIEVGWIH